MGTTGKLDETYVARETVLTIGVFDGVHVGHQHLLKTVSSRARQIDACSAVITFDPHPQHVLAPGSPILLLTTLEDRVDLIGRQEIDTVAVLTFTKQVARMQPQEFMALVLQHFKLAELWVGPDFAMGYRRSGNIPRLTEIGRQMGFSVHTVPSLLLDDTVVSSTEIRRLLGIGDVAAAGTLLGRSVSLLGKVVRGFERGRDIGFPTANLAIEANLVVPADGVYAVYASVRGQKLAGVANIGIRPTFEDKAGRSIEVHILDFAGDLYGQTVRVEFVERLRGEIKFANVQELAEGIHADIQLAREMLSSKVN